jgi:hypothetical protein
MSVLLGSLVTNSQNKSIYNSNMEEQISLLEMQQVGQNFTKPEYLIQFDDLCFDTISRPVGVNEANITITGVNSALQRNLDFQNDYSLFQETDMHYNVVPKDQFIHNNMTLRTSKRDFSKNSDRSDRTLGIFTGIDKNYVPKTEKVPLFEPMKNLTYVHGMPAVTSTNEFKDRYIASYMNNIGGNLPFESGVRVIPGINGQNQTAVRGNSDVRINPRNVDELRSEINQKTSYLNKPLETIKKGEKRGECGNITKYKKPDFRIQTTCDLVPTRSEISASYKYGKHTNITTQRNEQQTNLFGPAAATSRGDGPDTCKTRFEPAKKESYLNDNTHAVTGVNNKPVMTNASSYTNYETQRASTNYDDPGFVGNSNMYNSYTIDYNNIPCTTTRELINNIPSIASGITNNSDKGTYVFSNDMVLPTTHRELTSHNIVASVTNNTGNKHGIIHHTDDARMTHRPSTNTDKFKSTTTNTSVKQVNLLPTDKLKTTIRESTTAELVAATTNTNVKQVKLMPTDKLKTTIRETTTAELVAATTNNTNVKYGTLILTDKLKPTIKEMTSHNIVASVTNGTSNKNGIIHNDDPARITQRQSTNTDKFKASTSNTSTKQSIVYNNDNAKPTIRESTATMLINATTNNSNKNCNLMLTDQMKQTIRQMTEVNQYISNANISDAGNYTRDENDSARPTIRQQTENTQYIGALTKDGESTYVKNNDIAKPTIRQDTSVQTPGANVVNINGGSYAQDYNDVARTTIKETTFLQDYIGSVTGSENKNISHEAACNMTINERREISTYNRPANGKADLNGPYINRETVQLNNPTLYSYIPAPIKALDASIMPRSCKPELKMEAWDLNSDCIAITVNSNGRPSISNSSYYVTNNRISTLNDNPYVNDIYHQKNY